MVIQNWLDTLREEREAGRACVLVVVTQVSGSAPASAGARMVVGRNGLLCGTIGGGALELAAIAKSRELLERGGLHLSRETLSSHDQCCGGMVELMFDVLFQGPVLHVFGAGHVAAELVQILSGTRIGLRLVDHRDGWNPPAGLPADCPFLIEDPEAYLDALDASPERDFALIMTPTHDLDYKLVKRCLGLPFAWVGLIGSRNKARQFEARLRKEGLTESDLERLQCPIGKRNVGRSPREVALAIAHEVLLVEGSRDC